MEEKNIKLSEAIDICKKFSDGKIAVEELDEWGKKMKLFSYIPILKKLDVIMTIVQKETYSDVEVQEVKILELYKNLFFKVLLLYTNIVIDDEELCTYENYDIVYPVLSAYILGACKDDYNLIVEMIKESINLYNVKDFTESVSGIDPDALSENTRANRELIESIEDNKDIIEDLKDIMTFNDPMTKKVVDELKKSAKAELKQKKGKDNAEEK